MDKLRINRNCAQIRDVVGSATVTLNDGNKITGLIIVWNQPISRELADDLDLITRMMRGCRPHRVPSEFAEVIL